MFRHHSRIALFRNIPRLIVSIPILGSSLLFIALGSLQADQIDTAVIPIITDPAQIWLLSTEERAQEYNFRIEGRVSFFDAHYKLFWLNHEGITTYVQLSSTQPDLKLKYGQHVLLEGTMVPNEGMSDSTKVTVLHEYKEINPPSLGNDLTNIPKYASTIVTTEAYVNSFDKIDDDHLRLRIIVEDTPVICWVQLNGTQTIPDYQGKIVRLTGLYSGRTDPSKTRTQIELWVSNLENFTILHSLEEDEQFNIPITNIDQIVFSDFSDKIKIRGILIEQNVGIYYIIRDTTGQIVVNTSHDHKFKLGDVVDALGYPTNRGDTLQLEKSIIKRSNTPVAPNTDSKPRMNSLTVNDVKHLDAASLKEGIHIELTGVVTWSYPGKHDFYFFQDLTGGIRITDPNNVLGNPQQGKYLKIEGTAYLKDHAPYIVLSNYTDLGSMIEPIPNRVSLKEVNSGLLDGSWVELKGFVQKVTESENILKVDLSTPTGDFVVRFENPESFKTTPGALIRFRGVCETSFNDLGELKETLLRVSYSHHATVEEDAPIDLFDLPISTIPSLTRQSALKEMRRAKVTGIVIHHEPEEYITINSHGDTLSLFSMSEETLIPGDQLEAVGIIGLDGIRPVLRNVSFRKTGHTQPPQPHIFDTPGKIAPSLDEHLISIEGELIDTFSSNNFIRLTLQSEASIYEAYLNLKGNDPIPSSIQEGALLKLNGLYKIQYDDALKIRGFQLQLRSIEDIELLRKPRLITQGRALTAAGILASSTLFVLFWVIALRKRVEQQTSALKIQIEKEHSLELRFKDMVENTSDLIFTTSMDGQFTSFNLAGEIITGYTEVEALNMNVRDLYGIEYSITHLLNRDVYSPNNLSHRFQSSLEKKDTTHIWIETSAKIQLSAGKAVSILATVRDVSESKKIEEELTRARNAAEETTRAKSEFLANMSHEIRTPMNAIIGMNDLLMDSKLNDQQYDFSQTIRNGAESLLAVLNDILDFSKIEAGQLQFEIIDFDLRETVDDTVELLAAQAAEKKLDLTVFMNNEVPQLLEGDPGRLRQVLMNLLSNAIKFTETGNVSVEISCLDETDTSANIEIKVIDSGIGISSKAQDTLFTPFSQADSSTTRRFGGTGLGLAISNQLVKLMGGQVGVESEMGTGSAFWFRIDFKKQNEVSIDDHQQSENNVELDGKKLILVDDSITNCKIISHYLSLWGMETVVAQSSEDALKEIRNADKNASGFDLAIIDRKINNEDGFELIKSINNDQSIGYLPIVLLSSMDQPSRLSALKEMGISSSITKPVKQKDLQSTLHRILTFSPSQVPANNTLSDSDKNEESNILLDPISLRILLVEDNPINQRVAGLLISRMGHRYQAVANGAEAIETLKKSKFDIVLMDCQMPEMDGYTATRKIRKIFTEPPYIPIIALTANAMQGDREKCIEAGMDDYLSKPMRKTELQTALLPWIIKISETK